MQRNGLKLFSLIDIWLQNKSIMHFLRILRLKSMRFSPRSSGMIAAKPRDSLSKMRIHQWNFSKASKKGYNQFWNRARLKRIDVSKKRCWAEGLPLINVMILTPSANHPPRKNGYVRCSSLLLNGSMKKWEWFRDSKRYRARLECLQPFWRVLF